MADRDQVGSPGDKQPFADVLTNVGRPSLSASSDMPVIDLAKPAKDGAQDATVDEQAKPADTTDTSGKTEGEADAQPKEELGGEEKDKTSPQQRAVITREKNARKAAERENAELRDQMKEALAAIKSLTAAPEPKEQPRPTRDTFDSPEAYDQALIDWSAKQATAKATDDAKQAQTQAEQDRATKTTLDTFNQRVEGFEADHPDFQDVVYSDDLQMSPAMTRAILAAEDGPAIAYHLGQNPEMAERIAGLIPELAVYEIGKISAKLSAPPKPKPAVITPLRARNNAGPKTPQEMNMDEYAAYARERDKKKA